MYTENGNQKSVAIRDQLCASSVAKMAELGRFDKEFIVYGSAVEKENNIAYYYATSDEEQLYNYINKQRLEDYYYTPILSLQKRMPQQSGMDKEILQAVKYDLLIQLKKSYEYTGYFEFMRPLCNRLPNNNAFTLLCDYQEEIEGNFDEIELQLFWGMAKMAYEAKILNAVSYKELFLWYQNTKRQMDDDPVVEDNISRILYGFIYKDNETYHAVCDAKKMVVVYKQWEKRKQGILTGSIIEKNFSFQRFYEFKLIRENFINVLLHIQDEHYFEKIRLLKELKGVIEIGEIERIKQHLSNSLNALAAVEYYEQTWSKY